MISKRRKSTNSGQVMLELCLCLPFLLLVISAIFYFGRLFFTQQVVAYAARQGAESLRRVPNIVEPSIRESITGFSTSGRTTFENAPIRRIFSSAGLLSQGNNGDLPPGSKFEVLPFDDRTHQLSSAGTIGVRIEYPFSFFPSGATGEDKQSDDSITPESAKSSSQFGKYMVTFEATVPAEIPLEEN